MSIRKLLESWQRTLEQDEFRLSEPRILNEVNVFELGLPAGIAESINSEMKDSSREAKVKVGQMWKNTRLSQQGSVWRLPGLREMVAGFISAVTTTSLEHGRKHGLLDQDALEDPERSKAYQELSDKAGLIASNYKNTFNYATGADFMKAEKIAQKFFKKGINDTLPQAKFKSDHEDLFEKSVFWLADNLAENYGPLFEYLNTDEHGKHLDRIKDKIYLQSALETAVLELAGREDPDKIVHEYSDGYYWYNIGAPSCEIEGEKMKHCGVDSNATTLYSLRSPNNDPEVKFGRDHWVTIAYDEKNKVAYQIKGVENGIPEEKHFKKILDLLKSIGVERLEERGQYTDNKEGFAKFIDYLNKELDLKAVAWDEIKKQLMSYVNRWSEKPFRGVSIGFKMVEDEDGVIRYFPLALFSAEFPADILNEKGLKTVQKDGARFGENVTIRLVGADLYKYAPDTASKIHNFYHKEQDEADDDSIGGNGAYRGRGNAAWVRTGSSGGSTADKKLIIFTPLDVVKIVGPWALDGSAAIPDDKNDKESYANFYNIMLGVAKQESDHLKEGIRESMLNYGYIEGAGYNDIEQGLYHREIYTRGTLPPDTERSTYRDIPTDWEIELAKDENEISEYLSAASPTLVLNTAALLDEEGLKLQSPEEIKSILTSNIFGVEFMKELLKESGSQTEWSFDRSPTQSYLTQPVKKQYESRPYVFAIDWAMEIEPTTKDFIAKDFLDIISKIDTKDKIIDVAERAFINTVKKRFPEDKLDESTIRMWKRAIL
jgi:hypothetical protein